MLKEKQSKKWNVCINDYLTLNVSVFASPSSGVLVISHAPTSSSSALVIFTPHRFGFLFPVGFPSFDHLLNSYMTLYFVLVDFYMCLWVSYPTLSCADNSTILKHSAVSATHNWFCITKRRSVTKSQLNHVHFYFLCWCWCLLDSAWAEIADIIPRNEIDCLSLLHRTLGMGQVEVVIPKTTKEKELLHDWRANKKLNSECFDLC